MDVPLLPVWAGIGFAAICLALGYVYRHWLPLSVGLLALAAAISVLIASSVMDTPEEEIERAVHRLAAAVHHNDDSGLLELISASAQGTREEAQKEMNATQFIACWIAKIHSIKIDETQSPPTAHVALAVIADVVESRYGAGRGRVQLRLDLAKEADGVWRVTGYSYTVE